MAELPEEARSRILDLYHHGKHSVRNVSAFLHLPFDQVKEVVMEDLGACLRRRLQRKNAGKCKKSTYTYEQAMSAISDLMDGDSYDVVCKRYGVTPWLLTKWARPPLPRRDYAVQLATTQAVARDAVLEGVLRSLAREDQIEAALDEKRSELAQELYRKARVFWDRAEDKARVQNVPANELKALVYAATTAVHNAQLLGGQPTERVHQMLDSLKEMSDDELRQFVFGNNPLGENGGDERA